MRDGRAGLGHPPWQGGGGGQAELNALRLDASANYLECSAHSSPS